jgi:hypothetical protein
MTCAAPEAELLHALAAGTLDGAERDGALTHASSCPDCGPELATLREMVEHVRALHLTPEELVEAAWTGERPPHVLECSSCRGELETLRHVNEDLGPGRRRWGVPHTLAAAFLIASLGLTVFSLGVVKDRSREREAADRRLAEARQRLLDSEKRLEEASSAARLPSLNVPILDLTPDSRLRGSGPSRPQVLELPAGASSATLVLVTRSTRPHDSYALEARDASGRLVFASDGLERSPSYDTLTLSVPRALLAPGVYRITLYGLLSGTREEVEAYPLEVRHK